MTILILTNADAGLYNFRRELVAKLCEKHHVYISASKGEYVSRLEEMGCKFLETNFARRGMNPFADLKLLTKYKKMLREVKPDVVLTYTIKPNVYGGMACQRTKTPYLVNVTGLGTAIENGGILGFVTTRLYRMGLKGADCVFFQNAYNRDLFLKKKMVRKKHILLPGSGVNTDTHCYEEYPAEDGTIRFLFVGRIMKDKGIGELIEAMGRIKEKYPDAELDVLGAYDEDYSAVMEEAAKEGLLRYHGRQNNVHDYMKQAHCCVLPSYHEGMSNVMLEASSTGRPVITTRVPGCMETFEEGKTGLGCEAKDVESLVEAMEKFIALSYDEKCRMGLLGRKKMELEFDRRLVTDVYIKEIENVKQ